MFLIFVLFLRFDGLLKRVLLLHVDSLLAHFQNLFPFSNSS